MFLYIIINQFLDFKKAVFINSKKKKLEKNFELNIMDTTYHHEVNQLNISSLCLFINSIHQYIIMKTVLFMTTLLFLTTTQQVFSNPGIVAEAGDVPYNVPLVETPLEVDG